MATQGNNNVVLRGTILKNSVHCGSIIHPLFYPTNSEFVIRSPHPLFLCQPAGPHPAPPRGVPLGMPMNVSPLLGGHMPHGGGGQSMPFPGGFRPGQPGGQNHNPLQPPRGGGGAGGPRGTVAQQGPRGYGASPVMGPTLPPSQPVRCVREEIAV